MRRMPTAAALAGMTLSSALVLAAPAHADHVVNTSFDGSSCRWGAYVNPTGLDLWTSNVELYTDVTGKVIGYSCYFKDIPAYVSGDTTELGVDWYLPTRTQHYRGFGCWAPRYEDGDLRETETGAYGQITPAGTGKVTCKLPDEPVG